MLGAFTVSAGVFAFLWSMGPFSFPHPRSFPVCPAVVPLKLAEPQYNSTHSQDVFGRSGTGVYTETLYVNDHTSTVHTS